MSNHATTETGLRQLINKSKEILSQQNRRISSIRTALTMDTLNRRFDILMPLDLAQDMQDLEQTTGLSRGEIFRRAMALYKRVKETQSAGGNVILRDSDGTLREVVGI
jgi:hypothetical protein